MPTEVMEPEIGNAPPEVERRESTGTGNTFGRCPVCNKPLRPRCKITGEPIAPPVNAGYDSRAKCGGCGTILVYIGNYEWRVAVESDYDPMDVFLDGR